MQHPSTEFQFSDNRYTAVSASVKTTHSLHGVLLHRFSFGQLSLEFTMSGFKLSKYLVKICLVNPMAHPRGWEIRVIYKCKFWVMLNVDHCVVAFYFLLHYSDVIKGATASQITSLTIVYSTVYSRAQIKEIIKALRHCPLCGEFNGDRWIPRRNGQ